MATIDAMSNLFCPGSDSPVVFAGRQKEITEITMKLIEFCKRDSLSRTPGIHFLLGGDGMGKSTLLRYMYGLTLRSSDLARYIPVYTDCRAIVQDPQNLYSSFLQEIETSCRSSQKQQQLLREVFCQPEWEEVLYKIMPLHVKDVQQGSVADFFPALSECALPLAQFFRLFSFLNNLLTSSGLFIFWVIDHFELYKTSPQLLEVLIPCLRDIEKHHRRFFTLVSYKGENFSDLVNALSISEEGGIAALLSRYAVFRVDNDEQIGNIARDFSRFRDDNSSLSLINIAPRLNRKVALQDLHAVYEDSLSLHIRCNHIPMEEFTGDFCKLISEKVKEITGQTSLDIPQQQKYREIDGVTEWFSDVLSFLDEILSISSETTMVIFLEHFEKLAWPKPQNSPPFDFPSPAFIALLAMIESAAKRCRRIQLLPIMNLPVQELPREDLLWNSTFSGSSWILHHLSREDSMRLLCETTRCAGFYVDPVIIEDIAAKVQGMPLFLQHYGHYVIHNFLLHIEDNKDLLQSRIWAQYGPQDISFPELVAGEKGEVLVDIPLEFYQDIAPTSVEHLYRKLLASTGDPLGQQIITILCREGEITQERLFAHLLHAYPKMTKAVLTKYLHQMQAVKLFKIDEQIEFCHPLFRKLARLENSPGRMQTKTRIRTKDIPEYANKSHSQTKRYFSGDTKKIQRNLRSNQWQDFLVANQEMVSAGFLPDGRLLEHISNVVSLEENTLLGEMSKNYLKALCQEICRQTENLFDESWDIFLDSLRNIQQQGQGYDIQRAIEQTFFLPQNLSLHKNDEKYLPLARTYAIKYRFYQTGSDLEAALQCYLLWIERHTSDPWTLSTEINQLLHRLPEETYGYYNKLFLWYQKLWHLTQLQHSASLAKEIEKWSPTAVDPVFHSRFVDYCIRRIGKEKCQDFTPTALRVLSQYGEVAANHSAIQQFIFTASGTEKRYSYDFLQFLLPFFTEPQRQKVISWLYIQEEESESLQKKRLEIVSGYVLLIGEKESLRILQEAIDSSPGDSLFYYGWHCLERLSTLLSRESLHNIYHLLLDQYFTVLSQVDDAEELTEILLAFVSDDEELQDILAKKLFTLLKAPPGYYGWHSTAPLFSALLPKNKKQINEALQHLSKTEAVNPVVVANLHVVWSQLENPESLLLRGIGSLDTNTRIAAIKSIPLLIHRVTQTHRQAILEKLLDTMHRCQNQEQQCQLVSTLAQIARFFSSEWIEQICYLIIKLLKQGTHPSILIVDYAIYLFPYLSENSFLHLQKTLIDILLDRETPARLFNRVLYRLRIDTKKLSQEQIGCLCEAILEKMTNFKQVLPSAFYFFSDIWDCDNIPELNLQRVESMAFQAAGEYELAESALAFLARCIGEAPELQHWSHLYQFNSATWHLSFALLEVFPDFLREVPHLNENYNRLIAIEPHYLGLKMALFHLRIGAVDRARELLNWVNENTKMLTIRKKAITLLLEWNLHHCLAEQAEENWQQLYALGIL